MRHGLYGKAQGEGPRPLQPAQSPAVPVGVSGARPGARWGLRERARTSAGTVAWDRFGDGPPLVLVHGTPSSSFLWRNVVPPLAGRFSVYVLDLVGYGDSERGAEIDMSVAAQGRAFAELLRSLGLERAGLVGHDIGGATVLRAHLVEGAAASRIALVDAVAINPWNTPTTRHIREHLEAYRTMPAHIYEQVVTAHLATAVHRPLGGDVLAGYLAQWEGEEGQAAYFQKIAQWTEEDVGVLAPLLGSIAVPVRIVWGADDRWLDLEVARRLQRAIPASKLTVIPAAGHFSPEDAPAAVAAELAAFFSPAP